MSAVADARVEELAELVRVYTGTPHAEAVAAVRYALENDLPVWAMLPEIYPPERRGWIAKRRARNCSHSLLPYERLGYVCSNCGARIGTEVGA